MLIQLKMKKRFIYEKKNEASGHLNIEIERVGEWLAHQQRSIVAHFRLSFASPTTNFLPLNPPDGRKLEPK